MTSAESAKLAKVAQDLVQWIQNQALDGIGPLPSASDLADDYKRQSYANDAARVQGLIKWAVAKNAAAGFVAGLGGLLTLPVTIPGSLAASIAIQAPMVAAIAEIYGHDSKNDQVRTAILLCMIGTAIEDVAKQAGVTLGGRVALEALKNVPGKVLIEINKRVGFRLLTKFGERGVVNLAKLVPLVGGAVGGAFDGATCYMVGQAAAKAFRPTAAEHGMDAETWEMALDSYRYPVDLTDFRDAQKHRGWFDLKIVPGNLSQTMSFETRFRAQRSSKTDKFLTLIDLIGSGTRFSVDLDVGGREMAVGAVGNRVLGGFPSSLWARSLRPWGATASTAPALAASAAFG